MAQLFLFSIAGLFIIFILIAIYGLVKGNHGLILMSYLVVAYKTNLFDEINLVWFEPQYFIAIIWILSILLLKSKKTYNNVVYYSKGLYHLVFYLMVLYVLTSLKKHFLFGHDQLITIKTLVKYLLDFFVIYTLVRKVKYLKIKKKHIEIGIILGVFIVSFQSLFAYQIGYVGNSGFLTDTYERVAGFMKNDVNELTFLINAPLFYILILLSNNRINKVLSFSLILLMFISVLLTGSRTGLFTAFLVYVFYNLSVFDGVKNIFNYIAKQLLIGVFILIGAFILFNKYGESTKTRMDNEGAMENVRIYRWIEYSEYLSENPLYFFTGNLKEMQAGLSYGRSMHNLYIQTNRDLGIFFVLGFLFFIYSIYKDSNPIAKYILVLYMIYCLPLANPPIAYTPYIILYFNTFMYRNKTLIDYDKKRLSPINR